MVDVMAVSNIVKNISTSVTKLRISGKRVELLANKSKDNMLSWQPGERPFCSMRGLCLFLI